jgi:hypothetical protein
MWLPTTELQAACVKLIKRSQRIQVALEVFLYAMAFSAASFGLAALAQVMR